MKKNYRAIITKKELEDCKRRLVCMGGYKTVCLESGYYFEKISRDYGVIGRFDVSFDYEIPVFDDSTIDRLKATAKARGIPWFSPLF